MQLNYEYEEPIWHPSWVNTPFVRLKKSPAWPPSQGIAFAGFSVNLTSDLNLEVKATKNWTRLKSYQFENHRWLFFWVIAFPRSAFGLRSLRFKLVWDFLTDTLMVSIGKSYVASFLSYRVHRKSRQAPSGVTIHYLQLTNSIWKPRP